MNHVFQVKRQAKEVIVDMHLSIEALAFVNTSHLTHAEKRGITMLIEYLHRKMERNVAGIVQCAETMQSLGYSKPGDAEELPF